jgi:tetrahydromethanopterin S-methyltransferase subunit F
MIELLSGLAVGLSVGLVVGFVAAVLLIIPESNFRAI